jgi:hypothetical protein
MGGSRGDTGPDRAETPATATPRRGQQPRRLQTAPKQQATLARSLRTQQRVRRPHPSQTRISTPRRAVLTSCGRHGRTSQCSTHEHQQGLNIPDMALDAHPEERAPVAP